MSIKGNVIAVEPTIIQRLKWCIISIPTTFKQNLTSLLLKALVYLNKDSSYITHCRNEVPDWFAEKDDINRWIADGTVELLAVLSHQGHSGGSIGFALEFFKKMALLEPWGPLTGKESEWAEPCADDGTMQNKRCSHVFMREDGTAYDINGKVFVEPNGCTYTSRDSCVDIEFPYTPKTEYVQVEG